MNKTAMYAFSGDPITNGHINIIERACKIFDKVIVGIGVNPEKKYTFTLDERKDMAERSLDRFKNVSVISFEGLLIDAAYENGVDVIIRGIRNQSDFDYEEMLHNVNQSQSLGIDTLCIFSDPTLSHVSSSAVKAIQKERGFIHDYVPVYVKEQMERKLSNTIVVGITGTIGSGKSYVSKRIVDILGEHRNNVLHLDLDKIGHDILNSLTEPGYIKVREQLTDYWSDTILDENGFINRKILGSLVFGDKEALAHLNSVMRDPILVQIRKRMRGFTNGFVIVDGALLIESELNVLCNNNVIILDVNKKVQEERLKARGYDDEQIRRRIDSQYSFDMKVDSMHIIQQVDNSGIVLTVDNSSETKECVETIYEYLIKLKRGAY